MITCHSICSNRFLVCPMKHAAVVIDINVTDPIVIPLDEEVSNK